MLGDQASHDGFPVLLGARVLAIPTVEFVRHPLRDSSLVRIDGLELLRMFGHVVREGVGEFGREGFATLEAFSGETKCGGLKAGIVYGHRFNYNDCAGGRTISARAGASLGASKLPWQTTTSCLANHETMNASLEFRLASSTTNARSLERVGGAKLVGRRRDVETAAAT